MTTLSFDSPVHKDNLPDGSQIWIAEKHEERGGFYRVVTFDLDKEDGALSVENIFETETLADCVDMALARTGEDTPIWVPFNHTEPGPYYTQHESSTLAKALEDAIGIPAWRSEPVLRQKVYVVHFTTFFFGTLSSCGVCGVFTNRVVAEACAAERRTNFTNVEISEEEVL